MATINTPHQYIGAFNAFTNSELKLIETILYKMAPIDTCPLSLDVEHSMSNDEKTRIYERFLSVECIDKNRFLFSQILHNHLKDIERLGLDDNHLIADGCKGFLWKKGTERVPDDKQHRIDALLRHLRNSIAHGRVAKIEGYLLFEDWGGKGLSARILITVSSLKRLIQLIEDSCSHPY